MWKASIIAILTFIVLGFNNCIIVDGIEKERVFRFKDSLLVRGIYRTYTVNLPSRYYQTAQLPLIFTLHGLAGNAATTEQYYLINEKADNENYVIVYPEGVESNLPSKNRSWNAGNCCEYAAKSKIDDVGFINTLIDSLPKNFNKINKKKVYVAGMSNGGMLAYKLACESSTKIAAIASVSSSMVTNSSCNPVRAMPIMHIHSLKDNIVPFVGGKVDLGLELPSVSSTLGIWSKLNDCKEVNKVTKDDILLKVTEWNNCKQNSTIKLYLTKDGGHIWPGSGVPPGLIQDVPSKAIDANQLIFDFFAKFQLP